MFFDALLRSHAGALSMLTAAKLKCWSIRLPMSPTALPIVNAASIVPSPSPSKCPKNTRVITPVTNKQLTSKMILTFG